MIWDRKQERSKAFNRKKQAKNKARTKNYRKTQLREKEDFDDIKNWQRGLSGDTD
tara:strand:+ start:1889 stop:2053 length:165 start_codon:yes stop_codon:yes gene_type:complete